MRKPLAALEAGMQLQKPVLNPSGVLLLRAGETLTPKHLEIFQAWGIREAEVMGGTGGEAAAAAAEATLSPAVLARIEADAVRRFRRADRQEPLVAELLRLVTARLARRAATPAAAGVREGDA